MTRFRLRDQAAIEAALLAAIDELTAADPANAERVSWWGGQVVAYLVVLGAERGAAIEQMYRLWSDGRPDGED
jgi:hypothetical protein